MSQATWVQDQFSYGEISPLAAAKSNQEFYYKSLAKATNVIITPQSVARRRFGLKYIGNIPTADTFQEIQLYNFQIGAFSNYLMVVSPGVIYLYYEDYLCATLENPYPRSVIEELKFMQENGMPTFLNGYYQPKQIQRSSSEPIEITAIGSGTTLTTTGLSMRTGQVLPVLFSTITTLPTTIPQINATRIYFIRAVNLTDFAIYDTPQEASADINRFSISTLGADSEIIPQNSWQIIDYTFNNPPTFDFLNNYSENEFRYEKDPATFSILTGDLFFTEEFVKGIIYTPGQVLRVLSFIDSATLGVQFVDGNNDDQSWIGSDILITIPAFSDARGWPSCGCFFQSRAVLASTPTLPNFIAFSVISNAHDFDDLGIFDSDGISTLINSDNGALIFYVFASKTLIIFTAGGTFSTPYTGTAPLTANNTRIDPESEEFVQDIAPVWLDNNLFYVAGGGTIIKSMKFDITINSYNLIDASDFSSHLIRNPLKLTTYKNNSTNDINLLIVVNSDGTIACHNSVYQQKVNAWSQLVTKEGLFRYADGARGNCYFLVERVVNNQTQFYIEKADFNRYLDSSVLNTYDTPQTIISGLDNLNGLTVRVRADGLSVGDFVVEDGRITLQTPASEVEVGINVELEVKTLPFNVPDAGTYFFYHPKINSSVFVDYYNSYSVYVNGELIPMRKFDNEEIFAPPVPKTGFYQMPLSMDPTVYEGISITQVDPYPFTLRALGYEVKK